MEPILEGKQVLSDIEKSIQNALALFNSKELGEEISPLYVIDDPIVSLHDPESQKANCYIPNSSNIEVENAVSSENVDSKIDDQYCHRNFELKNTRMSYESINEPFLENPIQNTIEEIQRVLNAKDDGIVHSAEPSPEEILNIYSQDLGISVSRSASPRGDMNRTEQLNESDLQKVKQNKKEKKSYKKLKQKMKFNYDKKIDIQKGQLSKSENLSSQENKLRDLMNIYGCSNKVKKPNSDSTLGSKSRKSINASAKKTHLNESSKANSIAASKKSKRKKQKFLGKQDIDLCDGAFLDIESSRHSMKKKNKQKNNNTKIFKKTNLKRKLEGTTLNNDSIQLKSSKSYQPSSLIYNTNKTSNSNFKIKENNERQPKPLKHKNLNQDKKVGSFNRPRGLSNIEDNLLVRNSSKIMLPHVTQQFKSKNNMKPFYSEIYTNKNNVFQNKQNTNNEKLPCSLNKKTSEEAKINKQLLNSESDVHDSHNYIMEDSSVQHNKLNSDNTNKDYMGQPTQVHYALPTQSSRSKEVDRFLSGHYQHLPFVIGQSTNKSHNLWVNIQEALSLIKQKIPQANEEQSVVDETDSQRPQSVLSKLTIKSGKKFHHCPAVITDSLYDIPEGSAEIEEATSKPWEEHPDCMQANIDPSNMRPRCACLSQPSLSYKKVLRQLFGGGGADMSVTSTDINGAREDFTQDHRFDSYTSELRKALINFTQEFEDLNNKYEEMLSDPNISKEDLKNVEMQLVNKEEEIREIIARFNEVKDINEKTRLDGIKSRVGLYGVESYKSTTSVRLAQTLRRVQQFKESLKSRPSMPYLSKNVHVLSA